MIEKLGRRMGLAAGALPIALEEFGSTVSASIPLVMTHAVRPVLGEKRRRLVLAGFGVGLSWGAAALEVGPIVLPELEIVP
jgi:3-oxoacyl-[acyl-carrier-protein] synthase-3